MKSQKPKEETVAATQDPDFEEEEDPQEEKALDPYALAEPVNILSKLPADFWEQMVSALTITNLIN